MYTPTTRQAIIDNLKTQLESIPSLGLVSNQRSAPARNIYPCATLYVAHEAADMEGWGNQVQRRSVNVPIYIWLQNNRVSEEELESDLSSLAEMVEDTIVTTHPEVEIFFEGTDFGLAEDENMLHMAILNYRFVYWREQTMRD